MERFDTLPTPYLLQAAPQAGPPHQAGWTAPPLSWRWQTPQSCCRRSSGGACGLLRCAALVAAVPTALTCCVWHEQAWVVSSIALECCLHLMSCVPCSSLEAHCQEPGLRSAILRSYAVQAIATFADEGGCGCELPAARETCTGGKCAG